MKTITKLLLISALLITGVGGVKAKDVYATLANASAQGNATWTAGDGVYNYTWTNTENSENNYISLFAAFGGVANGELDWSDGTNFIFTCNGPSSSETNALDVIIFANGKKFSRAMYSDGTKTLTLTATSGDGFKKDGWSDYITAEDLAHVTDIRLLATNKWGQTLADGSVTISTTMYVQLSPKATLNFNASGVATIDLADVDVSGSTLSYDSSTGVVTSTGTSGTIFLTFDNANFSNVTNITVNVTTSTVGEVTYSDICGTSDVINSSNISVNGGSWYGSRYNMTFNDTHRANAKEVTTIRWNVNATGSMKINSITITATPMSVKANNRISLNDVTTYAKWSDVSSSATVSESANPAWEVGHSIGTVYGDPNVNYLYYADLRNYKTMKIFVKSTSGIVRAMFNRETNNGNYLNVQVTPSSGALTENTYSTYTDNVFTINLEKILNENGVVHLNAIKAAAGESDAYVDKVVLIPVTENTYDYVLSGQYSSSTDISEIASDALAKTIDCTGLSAEKENISAANPNCLFVAKDGVLSNEKNVIVSGACDKLVLTDGYPFKAPVDFTATNATYTTTINTDAKAGTLCLPFAATIPEGVKAYTLAYASGDKATATPVTETISANTPVLLNGSGECTFKGSGAVSASANNVSGALTGVFETGTVPTGSYVLQKQDDNVGFYKVTTDDIKIKPFRAYLTAQSTGSRISIVYEDEAAGIEGIDEQRTESKTVYDLQGRRVAQPTKGLYIVNGKLVIK